MMKVCPRCNQGYSVQDYDTDYVHICNSGIKALDKESVPKIDTPNWNLQGRGNKVTGIAKIKGLNVDDVDEWGNRKSTHKERQHYEYNKF